MTRQSMNVLLQTLERDGYVTRPVEASIGRVLPPRLTPRGRQCLFRSLRVEVLKCFTLVAVWVRYVEVLRMGRGHSNEPRSTAAGRGAGLTAGIGTAHTGPLPRLRQRHLRRPGSPPAKVKRIDTGLQADDPDYVGTVAWR